MKKKKRMTNQWIPQKLVFMKRIIIVDGVLQGKETVGIESVTVINTTGIGTMTGTMVEDVKEIGIEIEIEIETGKEIGRGREIAIGQEKKGTMVEIGSEKGRGKVGSEIEGTETVGGGVVVQGVEAGTAENGTVKMGITARGVPVAALAHVGGPRRMAAPARSLRRGRKRKRKRVMEPTTPIRRLRRPTGFELLLGWHL